VPTKFRMYAVQRPPVRCQGVGLVMHAHTCRVHSSCSLAMPLVVQMLPDPHHVAVSSYWYCAWQSMQGSVRCMEEGTRDRVSLPCLCCCR
jgi:hypothetical protein